MKTTMLESESNLLSSFSCSVSENGSADSNTNGATLFALDVQPRSNRELSSIDIHEIKAHDVYCLQIHNEATTMNMSFEDKCNQQLRCTQSACRHVHPSQRTMHSMDSFTILAESSPPFLESSDTCSTGCLSSLDGPSYPSHQLTFYQGSDPVKEEIDRLQNEVKEKNRELLEARVEIKALRTTERSREKALEELADELTKVDEKRARAELLLESKNLELKRMIEEKRAAQAAQHAAEAIVRRIHSVQFIDEELPPLEAILAPLDAELKLTRQEVARLQEDNRILNRLIKSKGAALLEAEKMVEIASSKASLVDDLQNKNQELMKRIDYCQEETKVLDKLHRQKVNEVEKLSLRVAEMEELLLSSGLNQANAVKDYQRQLHQLQDEKRALERELARVKLTANRVATTVVNGWRASNDNKVMPVKHWLEERRLLQSEMEQLRKKLVAMEKTSKTEAILKERAQMRLKVLEESTMLSSTLSKSSQARRPGSNNGSANVLIRHETFKSITSSKIISYNQFSSSTASSLDENLQEEQSSNGGKLLMCCSSVDHSQKNRESCPEPCNTSENDDTGSVKLNLDSSNCTDPIATVPTISYHCAEMITANKDCRTAGDCVSGYLYDLLQKEVIVLRKACQQKDCVLSDKENVIEMLEKKMCSLTRSMETESKKLRKEVATLGKEVSNLRTSASASHKSFISKQNKNIAHFQASKRGHE